MADEQISRDERLSRTKRLIGEAGISCLSNAHVAVFGIGGVGGYAAEALARSGIGKMTLVDPDTVSPSNLNRQIIALRSTVGMPKTQVMQARLRDIAEDLCLVCRPVFVTPENIGDFDFSQYDFIIDAVDTVSAKIAIIMAAQAADTPIISSMGTGNKLDPSALKIADISKTSVCPLARVMRYELRRRGVKRLPVVYSEETPIPLQSEEADTPLHGKIPPGSTAFVPAVAGLLLASYVVKQLICKGETPCSCVFPAVAQKP